MIKQKTGEQFYTVKNPANCILFELEDSKDVSKYRQIKYRIKQIITLIKEIFNIIIDKCK